MVVIFRFLYVLIIVLMSQQSSHAQICNMSSPMVTLTYTFQGEQTVELLNGSDDLVFTDKSYAQLWVKTEFLNVRDAPHDGKIIGKAFLGKKVHLFAKKGNWIAINMPFENSAGTVNARWIHKDYVSAYKTPDKISLLSLTSKCSFVDMYKWASGPRNLHHYCAFVRTYNSSHRIYGNRTDYSNEFYEWAKETDKLDELQKFIFPCGFK